MDETLIFDISSDDKEGFDDSSTADNFDWISKLFDDSSLENDVNLYSFGDNGDDGGDDGEVVFIGETIPKPKKAKVSLNECVLDDDDDDCVVLDCDPDEKDKVEINYGDGDGGKVAYIQPLALVLQEPHNNPSGCHADLLQE